MASRETLTVVDVTWPGFKPTSYQPPSRCSTTQLSLFLFPMAHTEFNGREGFQLRVQTHCFFLFLEVAAQVKLVQ